MKTVMIINESTNKLESTYKIQDDKVEEEVTKLKMLYHDVSVDNEGDVVAWK